VKILIIKPSALGDIVQALPVLTGLKRRQSRTSAAGTRISRSARPALGQRGLPARNLRLHGQNFSGDAGYASFAELPSWRTFCHNAWHDCSFDRDNALARATAPNRIPFG
jgi:hypothetical protein